MYCKHCGKSIDEDSTFCRFCGKPQVIISDTDSLFEKDIPTTGIANGHEWVDLGLSVKWATCNIGAKEPTDKGQFFAWGETEPKKEYSWNNYKWGKDEGQFMTKYCTKESEGKVDNKHELEKVDDAAFVNWGNDWRMPTAKEEEELLDGCVWEWTNNHDGSGVAGRVGFSKNNSNIIFLPAAGYVSGEENSSLGSEGFYWSSSLFKNTMNGSYFLSFANYYIDWRGNKRYAGRSVRAVVNDNPVSKKTSVKKKKK